MSDDVGFTNTTESFALAMFWGDNNLVILYVNLKLRKHNPITDTV